MKERSIRFKVIVNEEAKAGETILNKAKVDDGINPPEEPEVPVVPEAKEGKLTATKTVNNAKPKLGKQSSTQSASAIPSKMVS